MNPLSNIANTRLFIVTSLKIVQSDWLMKSKYNVIMTLQEMEFFDT